MTKRRLFAIALLALPLVAAGGCSLVNSFGDVLPLETDSGVGSNDAPSGDGTVTPPADSGGDVSASDSSTGHDSSTDGSGPITDAGVDSADSAPPPPTGVLVVGGNTSVDGGFILTTLDPATGAELNPALREDMVVVSVHYDGMRDLWYIFENTGIGQLFPAPNDIVYLHVRQLNTHTGAWTELSKLTVPAIVSTDTVAVLDDRLAYTAYALNDAGNPTGGYELVLVDTSNPDAGAALINPPTALANLPTGTIGTRNLSGTGGTINLLHIDQTACEGDASAELCSLDVVHVVVQSGAPTISSTVTIGAVSPQGSEGVGSYLNGGPDDVIAFPPVNGASGLVERFSSSSSLPLNAPGVTFGIANPHLEELAISECFTIAFVVGVPNDTQVYGVPLTGATSTIVTGSLGHAGQAVEFEPYTGSVITPFKANGSFALNAFALTGSASAPVLTNRANLGNWSPPADLEPNFVGVREPIPFTSCP
ncbi:MAG: hypothetical protein ACLQVI_28620 [Polyangiaceae bacterium]